MSVFDKIKEALFDAMVPLGGSTMMKCDECGHKFKRANGDVVAPPYGAYGPCPKCGSNHTYPAYGIPAWEKAKFKHLWEEADKKKKSEK